MKLKTLKQSLFACLVGVIIAGGKAAATPVVVPDFSFEKWTNAGTGDGLQDGTTTAAPDVGPSWLAAGNGGVTLINPTNGLFPNTTGFPGTLPATGDGTNCLRIGLGLTGEAWQTVGSLQSNTIYTLTVAAGNSLLSDAGQGQIALLSGSFPAGTIIGSAPVNAAGFTAGTFVDTTLSITNGQSAGTPLVIMLQGFAGISPFMYYDNVRLDASPAPLAPTTFVPSASPSINPFVGTLVTLSENPAGVVPFTYQWQSDNGSGGVTFSNVGGNSPTNVVDTGVTGVGTFEYRVVVSNLSGISTSAPVTLTVQSGAPVLTQDTLPASGSDVEGSSVTFTAKFDGSRPIFYQWTVQDLAQANPIVYIPGATNTTLTLTNIHTTDSGLYALVASNSFQVAVFSTQKPFTVNPVPPATNGVILELANQLGAGGNSFSPTWSISTNNDLLAGTLPSTVGPGNFSDPLELIAGTPAVLTDGRFGTLYGAGITSPDVITGGTVGSGAGQYLIYTLPASTTGWDLTNIVTYGGWADAGRDEQRYTLYYSTVAAPTNFTAFEDVVFNPPNPSSVQSATRVTIVPTGAPIVKNVARLKFDFTSLANGAENGYVGFTEFEVYGTNSAPTPVVVSDTEPGSGSEVAGGSFTFAATINNATYYQWEKVVAGVTNVVSGANSQSLTLNNLQPGDAGTYFLFATNTSGSASSSGSPLAVNAVGNALISGANLVANGANQTGRQSTYAPNWTIAGGSLIAGTPPSAIGAGNYTLSGCSPPGALTDGTIGSIGGGIDTSMTSVGGSAGNSVTYTLIGPASGYDITNIVSYGGWNDGGRDQQEYTVSYSTVTSPSTFITIGTVSFNPSLPGSVPSMVRLSLTPSSGVLATNVARIKFDFTNPGAENGWVGTSEITIYGSSSAAIPLAPYLLADTLPATGSDVVGSQVKFTASFNGTAPILYQWQQVTGGLTNTVPNGTNQTLILNNLAPSDAGSYQLLASNSIGVTVSAPAPFVVNSLPAANGNSVLAEYANQTANGPFHSTWTVTPGSVIAGQLPSSVGLGNFSADGEAGVPILTDGQLAFIGFDLTGLAVCGNGSGGHSITYTLPVAGYNITNIVSYGGWADNGRDQQAYTVSYSTVAAPATFTAIASANWNPPIPGGEQSADRVTLVSSTNGPIATNVFAVKFDFTNPAGENGYSGYSEFSLYGGPTAA